MSGVGESSIRLEKVSKFYGDVLGVNRVSLEIHPGITSLVGPNGAGKTTLMNLMSGLLRPSSGRIRMLGRAPDDPEVFRQLGYCTQYDAFPAGLSGRSFVHAYLAMHGFDKSRVAAMTGEALERVDLLKDADRKISSYSKGMRQRIKLAQAVAHEPRVILLDEPLNGLDPMARAEVIELLRAWGEEGRFVLISSHILHEVDLLSDRVVLVHGGYLVAEGDISSVRSEIKSQPLQIVIRCAEASRLGARLLVEDEVVDIKLHPDREGLLVRTEDADRFFLTMNRLVAEEGIKIESIEPADENVQAAYDYLIGQDGGLL